MAAWQAAARERINPWRKKFEAAEDKWDAHRVLRKFGAKARSEPTSVELEDYREVIELCDQMQQEWPEGWPAVRALKRKNSEEFLLFLRHVLEDKPPDTTYILVLDNAGYHRANKVMDFFKQHRGGIEPFWLPPSAVQNIFECGFGRVLTCL